MDYRWSGSSCHCRCNHSWMLVTFRPGDRERVARLAAEHFPETPFTVIGEMTTEPSSVNRVFKLFAAFFQNAYRVGVIHLREVSVNETFQA